MTCVRLLLGTGLLASNAAFAAPGGGAVSIFKNGFAFMTGEFPDLLLTAR